MCVPAICRVIETNTRALSLILLKQPVQFGRGVLCNVSVAAFDGFAVTYALVLILFEYGKNLR